MKGGLADVAPFIQFILSPDPHLILRITLNHLLSVRKIEDLTEEAAGAIDDCIERVVAVYGPMTPGDWLEVKHVVMQYFQSRNVRISVLLKYDIQDSDGSIRIRTSAALPHGAIAPGTISSSSGTSSPPPIRTVLLPTATGASLSPPALWLPEVFSLGMNIYGDGTRCALDPASGVVGLYG